MFRAFDATRMSAAALLGLALAIAAGPVLAQSKGGGKIVCWKDKSGKTVGCGDRVPPATLPIVPLGSPRAARAAFLTRAAELGIV